MRTYDGVRPALHAAGFRTIVPWLRGFGPTRFLSSATARSGQIAAMAQDMLDFADALGLDRFRIVGHDWGARIGVLHRVDCPRAGRADGDALCRAGIPGPWKTPALPQAQNFWYQWFMATERGADVVRRDGIAFARYQWTTWSASRVVCDESTFAITARSFENPDWAAITLHSYRVRWDEAAPDPRGTPISSGSSRRSRRSVCRRC